MSLPRGPRDSSINTGADFVPFDEPESVRHTRHPSKKRKASALDDDSAPYVNPAGQGRTAPWMGLIDTRNYDNAIDM